MTLRATDTPIFIMQITTFTFYPNKILLVGILVLLGNIYILQTLLYNSSVLTATSPLEMGGNLLRIFEQ